jgi:branched-chain amino acid aminotransferase
MITLIDGNEVDRGVAAISVMDDGFIRGDGAFEVVRLYNGRSFALERHLDRMRRSAEALELPLELDDFRQDMSRVCALVGEKDCHVRLIATRGGRRIVLEEGMLDLPPALTVVPVAHVYSPLIAGVKSLSYAAHMIARRTAEAQGCDDALLFSPATDRVLECPFTAFGWIEGDELFTPPLSEGILASITRAAAIDVAGVKEAPCPLGRLAAVDGAFVMGTGMELHPIREIRGIGSYATDSPAFVEAASALSAHIQSEVAPVSAT